MLEIATLLAGLFALLVILAAVRDVATFTIPNRLNLAVAAAFLPAALAAHLSWPALGLALGIGVAALLLGMAMFALGWIGGGDAKLFAACGLWLGGAAAVPFVTWTAIGGGVLSAALLLGRNAAEHLPAAPFPWMRKLLTPGESVPYGVAIAAGALLALPQSPVIAALHR